MNQKSLVSLAVFLIVSGGSFAQTPQDPGHTNVSFPAADGTILRGHLAAPEGSGAHPAVLMIHEWWGLNHDTVLLADALAKEGFVVLAADAFRGRVAKEAAEARKQVGETPPAQIASDLDSAFRFLAAHPRVRKDKVASLGFCFGGSQSMRMGARNADLAAIVIFYGGGPFQKPEDLGVMKEAGPVLGIYGELDAGIPVAQVRAFEAAMKAGGVEHTVNIYPGVGHAFVKSTTYNQGGAPAQAWNQAVAFLKQTLQ